MVTLDIPRDLDIVRGALQALEADSHYPAYGAMALEALNRLSTQLQGAKMTDITPVFYLPKWPALVVQGQPVTREQAAEIIIRTGQWPVMTNDKAWEDIIAQNAGCLPSYRNMDYTLPHEQRVAKYEEWEKSHYEFKDKYKILDLQYLQNERVASCWVGGAHGWMNWDGGVGCNDYNIGKWPTAHDVFSDWKTIAEAFPYLDLTCQLLNCETGGPAEGDPTPMKAVVQYRVKDGKVEVSVPEYTLLPELFDGPWKPDERGCSAETLKWALEVTAKAVGNAP